MLYHILSSIYYDIFYYQSIFLIYLINYKFSFDIYNSDNKILIKKKKRRTQINGISVNKQKLIGWLGSHPKTYKFLVSSIHTASLKSFGHCSAFLCFPSDNQLFTFLFCISAPPSIILSNLSQLLNSATSR